MKRRLCGGSGVALVLVTSKKNAMVVAGSTPPKYQEDVPLLCVCVRVNANEINIEKE